MGSIHQLLNPLNSPSPRRLASPKPSRLGEEDKYYEDNVVGLDAEAECYTPVERAKLRAGGKDNSARGPSNAMIPQVEITRPDRRGERKDDHMRRTPP